MGRTFGDYRWLKGPLSSPRAPLLAIALAVLVALPTLSHGIAADDYWHVLSFTKEHPDWAPMKSPWWNLFLFFDGGARNAWLREVGMVPWWTDDSVRMMFFRPLSCLTHLLDYTLWPSKPWLMHVQSIAWYAALVAVAGWTYRRLFERLDPSKRWIGNLAAVFYAVDYTHGLPVSWLANRNALVAGVFAIGCLGAHDVAVRATSPSTRARWTALSATLFLLGMCSGESTLAVVGYLGAHALWLDDRPRRDRIRSLVPHALALVPWLIAYRAGGFGAKGSAMYIEPLREPMLYVASVLQCVPMLSAAELGAPPPDLYVFVPTPIKAAILAVTFVFLGWASFALVGLWRASPLARAMLGGGVLSILPACATFPTGRLLVIPSFGILGAVAIAFGALVDRETWVHERGAVRSIARSYLTWAGLGHLFVCPLAFEGAAQQMPVMGAIIRDMASDLPSAEPIPERVVIVNAPDSLFIAFVLAERKLSTQPGPERMLVLAAGQRELRITRETNDAIVVEQEGGFYRIGTEVILRKTSTPLPVGSHLAVGDVGVDVLDTSPEGVARRARFHFAASPEDPKKLAFRRWQGGRLVPFTLPPIGETVTIPGQMIQLTPSSPSRDR